MEVSERLISVVLVTWNSAHYLPRCIEGIRGQSHPRIELIVVDNASTDASVALIEPHAARLIRNESNLGFSVAVNRAIAVASGEWVLVVNPDCHLDAEYSTRLVRALDTAGPAFGAGTGMLVRARGDEIEPIGEIDSLGIRMTRSGRHLDLGQGEFPERWTAVVDRDLPAGCRLPSGAIEVFGVSGAAAMYRRSFLQELAIDGEILDEDFFAFREDADLAWRARLFGWRALCEPTAIAHHVRRVTPRTRRALPPEVNMHSVKNRFLLRIKNEGAFLALRNLPFELARDLVVFVAALTIERTSLPAFSWIWRNRHRLREKRRAIQMRRTVSDRQLARWFR
ncbi:MAG TPA: glycosyltransferase family 2 protein [Thermoanaerobaculia bacterium]